MPVYPPVVHSAVHVSSWIAVPPGLDPHDQMVSLPGVGTPGTFNVWSGQYGQPPAGHAEEQRETGAAAAAAWQAVRLDTAQARFEAVCCSMGERTVAQ